MINEQYLRYVCSLCIISIQFIIPFKILKSQTIDPIALNTLEVSIKKVNNIKDLSYSLLYSYSYGDDRSVIVSEMGISYISIFNKDSVLFYFPKSNSRLETKDSVYLHIDKPTKHIVALLKNDFYTHGPYNIEKITIKDLLPKIEDLKINFIDSIIFKVSNNPNEYIIDEIHKPREFNDGLFQSKKSFNRYWIDKKTLLPIKRQRYLHILTDLNKEEIHIDDFSLSFPERNPATNFALDDFQDKSLRRPNIQKIDEELNTDLNSYNLIKIGMEAPNFSGKNIKSELEETLTQYRGKVVLLDFWYLSCAPCRQLMPILNKINEKYKNEDFVLLGVNTNDKNASDIKNYINKNSFSYKQWYLPSKEEQFYGIKAAPTTILIDKTGKVVFVEEGFQKEIEKTLTIFIEKEIAK